MSITTKYKGVHGDQKAKLVLKNPDPSVFSGMLAPLARANGVIFPYTPTIQVGHSANYGTYDMPHTNYQTHYYVNSPNPTLSLTATFTAQDIEDASKSAAALHFFKSMTKMDFGKANRGVLGTAGAPPPVLLFTAYGGLHFKNTPVVIKTFAYSLTEDPDYITFDDDTMGRFTVPTLWMASLELGVQIAPVTHKDFNIQEYRSGMLLNKGGWA